MPGHAIFRQIGKPEPRQRCINAQCEIVEGQLSLDAHIDFAAIFLELTRIQSATRQ
jgi:hypothetical protein